MEAGGLATRVLECGEGDEAIVCLHGSGSRADRWLPAMPLLAAAGFHVYAVDFPGHGWAAKPLGYPYGAEAFKDFTVSVLGLLPHDRVSLFGTSLGGHVAAWTACERPTQVRAAVLVGAVGLVQRDQTRGGTAQPIVDSSLDGVRAKLEFLVSDRRLVTPEWVREESLVNSSPGSAQALDELRRRTAESESSQLVGEPFADLALPTLLCWGGDDRWVPPEIGRRVAQLVTHAEMVVIARAGHAPYFERPGAFVEAATEFLFRCHRDDKTRTE